MGGGRRPWGGLSSRLPSPARGGGSGNSHGVWRGWGRAGPSGDTGLRAPGPLSAPPPLPRPRPITRGPGSSGCALAGAAMAAARSHQLGFGTAPALPALPAPPAPPAPRTPRAPGTPRPPAPRDPAPRHPVPSPHSASPAPRAPTSAPLALRHPAPPWYPPSPSRLPAPRTPRRGASPPSRDSFQGGSRDGRGGPQVGCSPPHLPVQEPRGELQILLPHQGLLPKYRAGLNLLWVGREEGCTRWPQNLPGYTGAAPERPHRPPAGSVKPRGSAQMAGRPSLLKEPPLVALGLGAGGQSFPHPVQVLIPHSAQPLHPGGPQDFPPLPHSPPARGFTHPSPSRQASWGSCSSRGNPPGFSWPGAWNTTRV